MYCISPIFTIMTCSACNLDAEVGLVCVLVLWYSNVHAGKDSGVHGHRHWNGSSHCVPVQYCGEARTFYCAIKHW